jgi:hypothetical protein
MTRASDRFSWLFDQALTLASLAHAGVPRTGSAVPYIVHPVHVARLLARHGFSEDVVIAGLLHDVLEDAKFGDASFQADLQQTFTDFSDIGPAESEFRSATETFMAQKFGTKVLDLVRSVTEPSYGGVLKDTWRDRKDEQLRRIATMTPDAAALKSADVLHDAQSVLRDVLRDGLGTLSRFSGSTEETLWYYGALADALRGVLPGHALYLELEVAVFELTKVVTRLLLAEASAPRCASCGALSKDAAVVADARAETVLTMTDASGLPLASLAHWFAESDGSLESFTKAEFDPMPSLDDVDAALTAGPPNRSKPKR